jgi:peptidoglycan-associated lipoprotein
MTVLSAQGCATQSGSGTGTDRTGQEERVGEQTIKEVDLDRSRSASRTSPPSDSSSRDVSGLAGESLTDVLFDFDRDTLRADALPVLEANATQLKRDGITLVLLEGRGDEIGTSAYNMVLGERRAGNVKNYLQQLGLAIDLKTTSYGKDRPLCLQRTSECMQKNRSVRFVVKG